MAKPHTSYNLSSMAKVTSQLNTKSVLTPFAIVRYFKRFGLELDVNDNKDFILMVREIAQARKYDTTRKFPDDFHIKLVASYLNIPETEARGCFTNLSQYKKNNEKSRLLKLLARKEKRHFVVTGEENIENMPEDVEVKFGTVTPATPHASGSRRYKGPNDTPLRSAARTGKRAVYVEATPSAKRSALTPRTEGHIPIPRDINQEFTDNYFANVTQSFTFKVTRENLLQRAEEKRPISQKQAVGGLSAADIFRAIGVNIPKSEDRNYHLAHRHGFGLGGQQEKTNIDPATKGSNYTTLFRVESVIRELLDKGDVDEVSVKGTIDFHEQIKGLPIRITYRVEFPNKEHFEASIYPLDTRVPTLEDHTVALALAKEAALSPPDIGPRKLKFGNDDEEEAGPSARI